MRKYSLHISIGSLLIALASYAFVASQRKQITNRDNFILKLIHESDSMQWVMRKYEQQWERAFATDPGDTTMILFPNRPDTLFVRRLKN